MTGLEPATPCTPCRCATKLRYTPTSRRLAQGIWPHKNGKARSDCGHDFKRRGVLSVTMKVRRIRSVGRPGDPLKACFPERPNEATGHRRLPPEQPPPQAQASQAYC